MLAQCRSGCRNAARCDPAGSDAPSLSRVEDDHIFDAGPKIERHSDRKVFGLVFRTEDFDDGFRQKGTRGTVRRPATKAQR